MPKNEVTSKRVAKIASKIMAQSKYYKKSSQITVGGDGILLLAVTWGEIVALAASALTQAPDKPKKKKGAKNDKR